MKMVMGGTFLTMIRTDSDSSHHIGTSFISVIHCIAVSSLKVTEVLRSLDGVGKTSAWLKALFQPNRTLLVIDMQVNSMRMAVIAMIITFGVMMMVMMIL